MLRMVVVFLAAGFAFVIGLQLIRRMRRSITEETAFFDAPSAPQSFPLHTYHAVIQQLKQQKHELQSLQLLERRRAKTSENISAAVLSNLSCGVLFFTANGLVRHANSSAKQILGFASPAGMSAAEMFREAELLSASDAYTPISRLPLMPACVKRAAFADWRPFIARPAGRNVPWILPLVQCAPRTPRFWVQPV